MAVFIGKEPLEKALEESRGNNRRRDIKGLEGELKVGNLLSQYLPDDTFVIAHPSIGKYDPDFLIISPKYGFRLVEVKNWSIQNIREVYSNGALKIINTQQNPLNQVKKHIDEFNGYIKSLKIPTLSDPYKMIGFTVLHFGFTKKEIEGKMIGWEKSNKENYFKHHIFLDQINNEINTILEKAVKYPLNSNSIIFSKDVLHEVIDNISITNEIKIDEVLEFFDKKLDSIEENIKSMRVQNEYKKFQNQEKPIRKLKKSVTYGLLISVVLILATGIFFFSKWVKGESNNASYSSLKAIKDNAEIGDRIKLEATVNQFSYDKNSGTKFLILTDGERTIDGVIFKGIETPYINKGNTYVFTGEFDSYKGKNEIVIHNVK
ncbi:NERD domain-containing protein [Metabacillus sp. KIGAM252]|uniref:NERD domain-containing protein n=1 Tax=Metabacillus flavus TaxID=2823519 RepID=A0ABS5LIU4_9BACI|nr:nuclease-related domain-containing protein [Metabacillus flavus]MBS2970536.1 NERD domain-containing protein [Metabacillus flavus]